MLFDASARVAHSKIDETRFAEESAYFDFARTLSDSSNRIERVQDQVDDELPEVASFSCVSLYSRLYSNVLANAKRQKPRTFPAEL
jgi:hypothetical protein